MKKFLLALLAILIVAGCSKPKMIEPAQEEAVEVQKEFVKVEVVKEVETKEESEYLDILQKSLENFSKYMNGIHENFAKAGENPSLYLSEEWVYDMKDLFFKISLTNDIFKKVEDSNLVPEGFEEIHSTATESFSKMSLAGDEIITGLEEFDIDKINNGTSIMQESIMKMEETNKMLQEKLKR